MSSNIFSINPTNVYVYLRVSTRGQTYKSNGLEDQCKICQDYFKKNFPKSVIIRYYTDIGSSYNEKNTLTNLNKLIKEITFEKNSLILVRDISRLGRNTFQVFNLLRKVMKSNSYIIGIEENLCWNHSRLMDRKFSHAIIDSEEHSDLKSIKQSNRIKAIKSMGGHIGHVPFGTRVIKNNNIRYIYKNTKEINTLRIIKEEFLKSLNVEKTTKFLNDKNIKNRGKNWTTRQISNILKKYFPNVIKNKNSDMVNDYFSKYKDYDEEDSDIKNILDSIDNVTLQTKPKRKYIKYD
jgi:DNA invertase Pin-like site-specific DNA recombinase